MLFAVPSKVLPALVASPVVVPIVLAVCKAVAVPALPVIVVVVSARLTLPLASILKVLVPTPVGKPLNLTPLLANKPCCTVNILSAVVVPTVNNGVVTLVLNVFAPAIVCVPVVITPLFAALASGKLNVCVLPVELIAKSVPEVPVAKFCTCACKPFNAVNPVVKVVITSHKCPFCVCSVIVLLEWLT